MNRRALIISVCALSVAGMAAIAIVVTQSLRPSVRAKADAIALEASLPQLTTYQSIEGRGFRLFIVRTSDDQLFAFRVPLMDGKVGMPDLHWWRPFYYCTDFRPGTSDGVLPVTAGFQCHDSNMPEWWASRWKWGLDGKALAGDSGMDDLPQVTIERVGERMRVYKWDFAT